MELEPTAPGAGIGDYEEMRFGLSIEQRMQVFTETLSVEERATEAARTEHPSGSDDAAFVALADRLIREGHLRVCAEWDISEETLEAILDEAWDRGWQPTSGEPDTE